MMFIDNKSIKENDIVILKDDFGKISAGSLGTVVHVYKNEIFEIEFINKDGSSTVETLYLNQFKLVI